ncbi:MAG: hypothetical protein ABI895_05425 [Deltaproteobacteria bacterium]
MINIRSEQPADAEGVGLGPIAVLPEWRRNGQYAPELVGLGV